MKEDRRVCICLSETSGENVKKKDCFCTTSVWYHDWCVHVCTMTPAGHYHQIHLGFEIIFIQINIKLVWSGLSVVVQIFYFLINKKYKYSHKSVVDERPFSWSLQHVVEVILEAPVPRVSAAALGAVGQRLPQQAEPGSLLPLRSHRTCRSGRQETVTYSHRVVHRPPPRLHIFQRVVLRPASRGSLQPEPGATAATAALFACVTSRHGITSASVECAGRPADIHMQLCNQSGLFGFTLTFT